MILEVLSQEVSRTEMWVACIIGAAATVEDLARRTISNWLCLAALLGGIGMQAWAHGWMGTAMAVLGAIGGFLVFLVFYLLGGMGGGDVKLMSGFGAILGIGRLLPAAILTAIIGAVIAAAVLIVSRVLHRMRKGDSNKPLPVAIPYAPAIAVGVCLTLFAGV